MPRAAVRESAHPTQARERSIQQTDLLEGLNGTTVAIRNRALTLVLLGILPAHGAPAALAASLPARKSPPQSTELPKRHPATLLMANFEATASRLITLVGGLVRQPPTFQDPQLVAQLHRAEAELLQAMASHVGQWERQIRTRRGLPKPPEIGLEAPRRWLELGQELNDPTANSDSLERLEQSISTAEANWAVILGRA